jgi:U3 small nucleolar RNA-associated protein 6
MAERIQHRKEKSLAEYEQMRRMNIFNDSELNSIKKQRDQHEQKIARQGKNIKYFTDYIEYEKNVMHMVEERRKSRQVNERYGIEKSIIRRIIDLFQQAQRYFPHEIRFWEQHLKFCQQFNMNTEVSVILEQLLNFHSDKPAVWARAINYEYRFNPNKNMERVRSYLLRAVQKHPENSDLYLQYFRIELEEGLKFVDENPGELEKTFQRMTALYQNCKTKIHSIDFYVDLLGVFKEFPFAQKLEKMILKDMLEAFPCDPILWHTLAQRELEGLHTKDDDEDEISVVNVKQKPLSTDLKTRISLCIEIYDRAVDILNTEKIWSLYINAMLDLNLDRNPIDLMGFKRKALGNAFRKGHEVGKISELHYQQYLELLLEGKSYEMIAEVIEKATHLYPDSSKLWEIWMKLFIAQNDDAGVEKKFK